MSRYIVFEGLDSIGKSTQLHLFKMALQNKGIQVHPTRALGGDGTDEFQNNIRNVILSNKFPKEEAILEEKLFALTDRTGSEEALKFLRNNPEGIVLKDRGLISHFCYAAAKNMDIPTINEIFTPQAQLEAGIHHEYGVQYVVLIPDNIEWLDKRLQNRNKTQGVEIVTRLENQEFQKLVLANILTAVEKHGIQFNLPVGNVKFDLVRIAENDDPQAVQTKIMKVLNN